MHLRLLSFLALVLLPAPAQTRAELPPATTAEIEKIVTREMSRLGIPGASLAVVVNQRVVYANGFGLSDVENSVPAKAATVYRLASISKPLTATAAMQLVESGKMDLDAPVRRYVPGFPEKQWPVTIRELLCHQGGIRHYRGPDEPFSTRHYRSVTDALAMFQDDPLVFEPGTRYLYTSFGYNLLGAAVEAAAGTPFIDYLRTHIFQPAAMETARADDVYAIIPNRAQGYRRTPGGLENSRLADTSNKIPSGGLCATAVDLARFAIALQKGVLVRPASLDRMWTPSRTRDGKETGYGLGWTVSRRQGRQIVAHGGAQARVSTMLHMVPQRGFAVAWMSNLENSPARVAVEIEQLLLK